MIQGVKGGVLTEFGGKRVADDFQAHVFSSTGCRYDMILGRKEIEEIGINFDFENHEVSCSKIDKTIPMETTHSMCAETEEKPVAAARQWIYEIDTVHFDGRIETTSVPCWGAGTLGSPEGKNDVLELCSRLGRKNKKTKPLIIGLGVTEAGLSNSSTKAMKDLYDILVVFSKRKSKQKQDQKICVINTDNVSKNGNVIRGFMQELASEDKAMQSYLNDTVVFHNTMVDRITSQRPNSNGLVPRAEPTPLKALVIEDLEKKLPKAFSDDFFQKTFGVVERKDPKNLDTDIALKLRIANGTHTAIAHTMALTGWVTTDVLSSPTSDVARLLMGYLDSFYKHQIESGLELSMSAGATEKGTIAVWEDWRKRLTHAHFGLSTFFITQNGAAKAGIRIAPTIKNLLILGEEENNPRSVPIECSTAFALAAILRFLTPASPMKKTGNKYGGTLDHKRNTKHAKDVDKSPDGTVVYADGLTYDLEGGKYDFRCDCQILVREEDSSETPLPEALLSLGPKPQPADCEDLVFAYLCKSDGGDLSEVDDAYSLRVLAKAVATLYSRMACGESILDVLKGLNLQKSCGCLVDGESFPDEGSSKRRKTE